MFIAETSNWRHFLSTFGSLCEWVKKYEHLQEELKNPC